MKIFFNGWEPILRTLIVGVLAYAGIVALLRVSGKRTLSKMNAFDLLVTVALGSTLATILISKDVALVQGIVALALLIGLQFIITWLSVRSKKISSLVKARPALLFYRGNFISDALLSERVTKEEVLAAIRSQGFPSISSVGAVVLETDGSFSVLRDAAGNPPTTLRSVRNASEFVEQEIEKGGANYGMDR